MIRGYVIAGLEMLIATTAVVYCILALAGADPPVPLWGMILLALACWAAVFELLRHAVEMARYQRRRNKWR